MLTFLMGDLLQQLPWLQSKGNWEVMVGNPKIFHFLWIDHILM
jgi:hypothetical protein